MSEIIVISDDDGLEEGEIADDIEPEPVVINDCKPKGKKLPRRYILHENKDLNSKHTKQHRHTSRHHKKHHKSCPHRSLEDRKFVVKQLGHIKGSSSQSNHRENRKKHKDYISAKSAFKNFASPRREPVLPTKQHNNNNQLTVKNVNCLQQILTSDKTSKELREKDEHFSEQNLQKNENSLQKCVKEILNNETLNLHTKKQSSHKLQIPDLSHLKKINNESEDEDEEELRRIALSTCLKRSATDSEPDLGKPAASFCDTSNVNNTDKNSCNQVFSTVSKSYDIYSSNNYEVVDMELDDDSPTEDGNSNDLFVIDKNPLLSKSPESLPDADLCLNRSVEQLSSKVNKQSLGNELRLPSGHYQSNDDFEEKLLRAEVIASINLAQLKSKKIPEKELSPLNSERQTLVKLPLINKVPAAQNVKAFKPVSTYCKPPTLNFMNMASRRVVNKAKLNYSRLISHKKVAVLPQRKINAGPERFVITLNKDSSTESDEECEKNKETQENVAVASIEALISDARQQSDIQKTNNNVSCLSKAQQEEYNALKKILAQKQVLPKQPTLVVDKNASYLKLLAKRISAANDLLSAEKKALNDVEKEVLAKKKDFMASKLKAQHLKEQLHAAELVRASNLDLWKKSAAKLDIHKKSVSNKMEIVNLLEKELSSSSQLPEQNSILSLNQRNNSLAT